jgi:hypothetical protein
MSYTLTGIVICDALAGQQKPTQRNARFPTLLFSN